MTLSLRTADRRTLSLLDGLAVFWLVLWLLLGGVTGWQIWQLTRIPDSARVSAAAVDSTGEALQGLRDVPVVGDAPADVGDEIRLAADDIRASADETEADVRRLAVLLGVAVGLIPAAPLLVFYLPARLARRQETRQLARRLREVEAARGRGDHGASAALDAYLAQRALQTLPYETLRRATPTPGRDLTEGRFGLLAAAELRRLGITPPARMVHDTAPGSGSSAGGGGDISLPRAESPPTRTG